MMVLDSILGSSSDSADSIDAGPGADDVDAGAGDDTILGGSGGDSLLGGTAGFFTDDNMISGGTESDTIDGRFGDDTLEGRRGDDSMMATPTPTRLRRSRGPPRPSDAQVQRLQPDSHQQLARPQRAGQRHPLRDRARLVRRERRDRRLGVDGGSLTLSGSSGSDTIRGGAGTQRLDRRRRRRRPVEQTANADQTLTDTLLTGDFGRTRSTRSRASSTSRSPVGRRPTSSTPRPGTGIAHHALTVGRATTPLARRRAAPEAPTPSSAAPGPSIAFGSRA